MFCDWFVWHMRRSLSPGAALTAFRAAMELDVSDVLTAVRVPTLVIPRPSLPGPGHYAAERIRGAEIVELPPFRGRLHLGRRRRPRGDDGRDRALRLTSAAGAASRNGCWRPSCSRTSSARPRSRSRSAISLAGPAERHHAIVRRELARFQAERSTLPATDSSRHSTGRRGPSGGLGDRDAGRRARARGPGRGPHRRDRGRATARSAGSPSTSEPGSSSLAGPAEVLAEPTVKDLIAGSGLRFEDRGEHQLKGIPDTWHLFAVVSA